MDAPFSPAPVGYKPLAPFEEVGNLMTMFHVHPGSGYLYNMRFIEFGMDFAKTLYATVAEQYKNRITLSDYFHTIDRVYRSKTTEDLLATVKPGNIWTLSPKSNPGT